jgi:hypothetical protein
MRVRLLSCFLLTAGCAAQPPGPTAPSGTVAWAQQTYSQSLQRCQLEHRRDELNDAGMDVTPTQDDVAFSQCLTQPTADLAAQMQKAQPQDAGTGLN